MKRKFKIIKYKTKNTSHNILGISTCNVETYYVISCKDGFFNPRKYLYFKPEHFCMADKIKYNEFFNFCFATKFKTKDDAQNALDFIMENPDRFILM